VLPSSPDTSMEPVALVTSFSYINAHVFWVGIPSTAVFNKFKLLLNTVASNVCPLENVVTLPTETATNVDVNSPNANAAP
jgi:hypothetical protein